ncbi:transposase [Bacillus sp. Marseille-Q3570]|uniref:transposase n=1 Tax=Bacillus sp. Marseille-Q3570 TaxID=2963522 RepID=UPI0037C1325A
MTFGQPLFNFSKIAQKKIAQSSKKLDCTACPLKAKCTKAKGNRQVHWNPVYEEMKSKACEDKLTICARRKVEVESAFGHIKGNRSFCLIKSISILGLWQLPTIY